MAPLLAIEGLTTQFTTARGSFAAVDGINLTLEAGRSLAIVGESGSGKSVTSLSIMGLIPNPPGQITAGQILFDGQDLVTLPKDALRDLRGDRLAMIFQEPMTSLNPAFTIGDQIIEGLIRHRGMDAAAARARAIEMLERVRIPAPAARFDDHPHRLSGGMRQRAMIAMALACGPQLLIADEPTTALDVTVQAQILDLLRDLQRDLNMAILLITHDLGVVADMADAVAVMYAGQIVEAAPTAALFTTPHHPYTIGLLGSLPRLDQPSDRLAAIGGNPPDPAERGPGCPFVPRCPFADSACSTTRPPMMDLAPDHRVACWKAPL